MTGNFFRRWKSSYYWHVFTVFFGSSLILLSLFAFVVSYFYYQSYGNNITAECENTVREVGLALQEVVEECQEALTALESTSNVQRFLEEENDITAMNEAVMRQLYSVKNQASYNIEFSVVETGSGRWASTSSFNTTIDISRCMNWGIFRKAQYSSELIVYAVPKDIVLEDNVRIAVAKSCRNEEGELTGFLLAELSRSVISDIVNECGATYNTNFMLINGNGSVIYHSAGTDYEGRVETGEDDGDFAEYFSEALDLYVLQEYPSDITAHLVGAIIKSIGFGFLAIVVLGLIFSMLMARSVSRPVRRLRHSMLEIQHGNLGSRVRIDREDELGMLGETFNQMLDEINKLMANIDEKKHSLWLAETKSLNLQMNPHFLYNTLDLIKWSAKLNRPQDVEIIVVNLAKLLRKVMDIQQDMVSLRHELELITNFIALENLHFDEEMIFEVSLQEELLDEPIPKLILQPLVENAIVHGFKDKNTDCRIQIAGSRDGEYLLLTVRDNGVGMTAESLDFILQGEDVSGYHVGLRNVERRAKLYGDALCGLYLDETWTAGTALTLRVRKHEREV